MKVYDQVMLRAIQVAQLSKENGNLPFAALLVDRDGKILMEAQNTVITEHDNINHAEINLIHHACRTYEPAFLRNCVIYTSTEPCAMCSSAIFWSAVRGLVFGVSKEKFYEIAGTDDPGTILDWNASKVLSAAGRKVEVVGPVMEKEAITVHENFWN